MATIEALTFTITRTSHPIGHICRVDYSYYLSIDADKYLAGDGFSVLAQLYAEDMALDQSLGERFYDAHVVDHQHKMPVRRSFIVPCEVLDEALGIDRIYLKLIVKSSDGAVLSVKSATIRDRF
ncbi:hypothetical protein [Kaarinaea lacus]